MRREKEIYLRQTAHIADEKNARARVYTNAASSESGNLNKSPRQIVSCRSVL